jgi:hypothetical protein
MAWLTARALSGWLLPRCLVFLSSPPVRRRSRQGPAEWLKAGVRDDHSIGSIQPVRVDAHARVFHPSGLRRDEDYAEVRWSEAAAANGRVMHGAAEWGSITGSWYHRQPWRARAIRDLRAHHALSWGHHIDLMTTYVGGREALIDDLLNDSSLEAYAVPVDHHVTWDPDTINPLPAPPGSGIS